MTPQVNFDVRDRVAHDRLPITQVSTLPEEQVEKPTPRELTAGERQGLAMGWVVIALVLFLLLGGLALWAAATFSAGFWAWLLSVAVMGVVTVATVIAANYFVMRPRH